MCQRQQLPDEDSLRDLFLRHLNDLIVFHITCFVLFVDQRPDSRMYHFDWRCKTCAEMAEKKNFGIFDRTQWGINFYLILPN